MTITLVAYYLHPYYCEWRWYSLLLLFFFLFFWNSKINALISSCWRHLGCRLVKSYQSCNLGFRRQQDQMLVWKRQSLSMYTYIKLMLKIGMAPWVNWNSNLKDTPWELFLWTSVVMEHVNFIYTVLLCQYIKMFL